MLLARLQRSACSTLAKTHAEANSKASERGAAARARRRPRSASHSRARRPRRRGRKPKCSARTHTGSGVRLTRACVGAAVLPERYVQRSRSRLRMMKILYYSVSQSRGTPAVTFVLEAFAIIPRSFLPFCFCLFFVLFYFRFFVFRSPFPSHSWFFFVSAKSAAFSLIFILNRCSFSVFRSIRLKRFVLLSPSLASPIRSTVVGRAAGAKQEEAFRDGARESDRRRSRAIDNSNRRSPHANRPVRTADDQLHPLGANIGHAAAATPVTHIRQRRERRSGGVRTRNRADNRSKRRTCFPPMKTF